MKIRDNIGIGRNILRFCLLLVTVLYISPITAQAKSKLASGTIYTTDMGIGEYQDYLYDKGWNDLGEYKNAKTIKMKQKGVVFFSFEITRTDRKNFKGREKVRFYFHTYNEVTPNCKNEYGEVNWNKLRQYSDSWKLPTYYGEKKILCWYFPDQKINKGDFDFWFHSYSDLCIKYTVYYYKDFAQKINVPKSVSVMAEKSTTLKYTTTPSGSNILHGVSWKSSNNNIAEVEYDCDNKIKIYGLKPGNCILTGTLENGKKYQVRVTVKTPKPKLSFTSCTLEAGYQIKAELKYTKKKVTWKSSNSKIAKVNSKGVIKGIKKGNCIVTAKCDGKSYKLKVKVTKGEPWFRGELLDYNTRDNYFKVKIKNFNKKNLIIKSSNAKAIEDDYKVYDRKLYISGGNVTIKPNKTAVIKFKVKGGLTWPYVEDYYIYFDFIYDGTTYRGQTWYNEGEGGSAYKEDGQWYYSW